MAVKVLKLPLARRFYQSVRLIIKHWRRERQQGYRNWDLHAVQFTSSLKLTSMDTEVDDLYPASKPALADFDVVVNDFGLLGTHGALPHSYTEWVTDQLHRYNDEAIKHFLDIFNHRVNTLRFELWKKTHPVIAFELDDEFTFPAIFNAVAGRTDCPFISPDNAMLWGRQTFVNLQSLLQREFMSTVGIIPFRGRWVDVESDARTVLGGRQSSLGRGNILGNKYRDIHAAFHVKIGPVPGAEGIEEQQRKLVSLITNYLNPFTVFTSEFIFEAKKNHSPLVGLYRLGVDCYAGERTHDTPVSVKYLYPPSGKNTEYGTRGREASSYADKDIW
ncbi:MULTISPECIES: type VI secretion system baseplate subunit TssG [Enterobacteriaceae]|uniref:type VI secretion system baseplate subunit TssG n=1 Tax=Enterobacteriaceae TaxID=543 RepID=UPI000BE1A6D1|nr:MULTISPECIES: type VI secretion system baseplate subunit TssG [Enterobacteriaceae]EBB6210874.1 type VI secretion system baseplate subunit TssG [Salmonella enterica]EBM0756952.1 type VI secretion system baseplate subunit TssG [Salmonella enterica subsp. enterica serovar Muenchen]EBZ4664579.1 hypothetical protein [Salmonella enterica subsp. enterica serovar Bovismorbificans]ECH8729561.1 hypothetical protein [Salmonella enterica subsp. enterica]ECH8734414.1 hypothetical protein [Salmonella ent